MKGKLEQKGLDCILWIGNDAIHIWKQKENATGIIPLEPFMDIPHIPKFHAVWDGANYSQKLNRAMGGVLRIRISRILMAIPDDATLIEKQALTEYAIRAGFAASGKRFALCSQSLILNPLAEEYIAVTWTCRCICISLVNSCAAEKRVWLDISQSAELASEIAELSLYKELPVYYPQIEPPPFPLKIGVGLSLEKMADGASAFFKKAHR